MEQRIRTALIELGVNSGLKGFDYLVTAIEILQKEQYPVKFIGDVCVRVAKKHGVTMPATLRAMRYALSKANTESEAWKRYIAFPEAKLTTVIYSLVARLKEEEENENKDKIVDN